jgi:hypothetical protein
MKPASESKKNIIPTERDGTPVTLDKNQSCRVGYVYCGWALMRDNGMCHCYAILLERSYSKLLMYIPKGSTGWTLKGFTCVLAVVGLSLSLGFAQMVAQAQPPIVPRDGAWQDVEGQSCQSTCDMFIMHLDSYCSSHSLNLNSYAAARTPSLTSNTDTP